MGVYRKSEGQNFVGLNNKPLAIILMGVSGCGKSTVGRELERKLGWEFFDGDDFHPQENVLKMTRGVPLEAEDRWPWLRALHQLIEKHLDSDQCLVVACSALKEAYRYVLRGNREEIVFVYLKGDFERINDRLKHRAGHYMKAEMLRSQFADLEEPEQALTVSIEKPVQLIVEEIIKYLSL